MKQPEPIVRKVTGLPLSARMISMGVTGMIEGPEGWRATFDGYPNLSFVLPAPVVDWLFASGAGAIADAE